MHADLVLKALLSAVWRRKPEDKVIVHSDQGSQYSSYEWQDFLKAHNLDASMSRRGNCHDNAVAESFFHTLKTELVYHKVYETKAKANQSIFEYIEVYYNRQRPHSANGNLSPVEFEKQRKEEQMLQTETAA